MNTASQKEFANFMNSQTDFNIMIDTPVVFPLSSQQSQLFALTTYYL